MLYYTDYDYKDLWYDYDFDVSVDDVKYYQKYRSRKRHGTINLFEFGVGNVRFDHIQVDVRNRVITIYEFKSSRNDFASDNKWRSYLQWCNRFAFVCPRGCIAKDDLPKGVGLYYVFKWKHGYDEKFRKGNLGAQRIVMPKRQDISRYRYFTVVEQMLVRCKYRRDDVF